MNETKVRYVKARERVERVMLMPVQELLASSKDMVDEAVRERDEAREFMEAMRPHWAKGHTDDSVAAQMATTALSELWQLLGAESQTEAVSILKGLIKRRPA